MDHNQKPGDGVRLTGQNLKPGDRVRLTGQNLLSGYRRGDKGTVVAGQSQPWGAGCYIVHMDKDPRRRPLVFVAEEIEADI